MPAGQMIPRVREMNEARGAAGAGSGLRVFVSAGEVSGDRQAAALINLLRQLRPELEVRAVGGPHLAEAGAEIWLDSRGAAVMGLGAALLKAPVFLPKLLKVRKRLREQRPEVAVLVDWGGVNVRLARWLRHLGIPTLYYLPPRSWDRRARREIAFLVEAVATQFPWSKHILSGGAARVEWVGHPLVDLVQPTVSKAEAAASLGLHLKGPVVALLPGSRKAEVRHCLPVLLNAAERILRELPQAKFLIAASEETLRLKPKLLSSLRARNLEAIILEGMDYNALQCADAAAAVSGTATLELALLGIPLVVIYRGSLGAWLQYRIMRRAGALPSFLSLPNLIADRPVVTELIQREATPERLAEEVISLLRDREVREKMKEDLASVCRQLGPPGAIRRTAEMLLDLSAYGRLRRPALQPTGAKMEN